MLRTIVILAAAQLASAHFRLTSPLWRADSLAANTSFSQWNWPCAGVPYNESAPRTEWPLTGGSVAVNSSHEWDHVYINIGLGNNVSNFNVSLTPLPLNKTGKGVLCIPALPISISGLMDGQNASIQVVMGGGSGNALYNCADIKFKAGAALATAAQCFNDTGVTLSIIGAAATNTTTAPKGAASAFTFNTLTLSSVVGFAIVMVCGSLL